MGKADITARAVRVHENLKKALAAGGADFSDLVRITVYVTDLRYREAATEVRRRYISRDLPTSTFLVVEGLANVDYLIEIDSIAVVD